MSAADEEFLALAVRYVCGRLAACQPSESPPAERRQRRRSRAATAPSGASDTRPGVDRASVVERLRAADAPTFAAIAGAFGLTPFEQDVVLLCIAAELEPLVPAMCAGVPGEPGPWPTLTLANRIFDGGHWDVVSADGPLRRWRLIEIVDQGPHGLTAAPLRVDERILCAALGISRPSTALAGLVQPAVDAPDALTASQRRSMAMLTSALVADRSSGSPYALEGATAPARAVATAALTGTGWSAWELVPDELARIERLDDLALLLRREHLLSGMALLIDLTDADERAVQLATRLALRHVCPTVVVGTSTERSPLAFRRVEVPNASDEERLELWSGALGESRLALARRVASQFDIDERRARSIATLDDEGVWDACRRSTRPDVAGLATRREAESTWDDIVLPAEQTRTLEHIVGQVVHRSHVQQEWGFALRYRRGAAVSALFAGEPGTGKTLAAEVIANTLELDLYCVDLAAVVSKYIGDTPKHTARLFREFEGSGAVLFFDEADALFGPRAEVRDSHDRYANIEIDDLLQRVDAYRGVVILATNRRDGIDPAFLRRMRYVVEFPFPGPAERQTLWERAFPKAAARTDLDWRALAQLSLTGGSIANAAINAAYLAAADGTPIGMAHVLEAAGAEMRKQRRSAAEVDELRRQLAKAAP